MVPLPKILLTALSVILLSWLGSAPAQAADEPTVIRSARSGPWSAFGTWEGGKVPAAGNKVYIAAGHKVVYDAKSDQVIRSIHIDGTLTFAHDRDTRLDVGLIRIQANNSTDEEGFDCTGHFADPVPGKDPSGRSRDRLATLEVGTPLQSIDAKHTAWIRLVYVAGMNKDSCPAIVCCGGRMSFHGAVMSRTWVNLGAPAKTGDKEIALSEPVTGWKVGDRIIITATKHNYGIGGPLTEERIIQTMAGNKITLDQPLTYDHLGSGDYRAEVANLSRNVIVESADPKGVRGHTMYHKNSAGSISYAEFRHLGKAGVLGRYSLHYHLAGDTMRGSSVIGASIWDSDNRWLTIHGTNYLVVRDCVGYGSLGHGFFLEDGTEVYNVLDRNLAVGARRTKRLPKQALGFDGNEGAGYWWANSLNTFTRNVAAENGNYGFRYEASLGKKDNLFRVQQPDGSKRLVDIRTLPFVRFDDNEVHSSSGLYGFNLGEGVNRIGPDVQHPFIVRNMKIWDVHYGFRPQAPNLLVENMVIHKVEYGVYHPNYDNHEYHNLLISQTNTEPFNRGHDDASIQYGPLAVDGLTFDGCRSGGMPLIQISDDNPTGKAETHMRNVKTVNWKDGSKERALVNLGGGPRPTPKSEKGVPIYLHDWYGSGKTAMVVSMRSGEYKADTGKFHQDFPLTGNESRVAQVADVKFPKLLTPIDDLPPITVITHIQPRNATSYVVRGTTSDNGPVKKVVVNGVLAKATAANFAEWEAVVTLADPAAKQITAFAEDMAGNIEPRPHAVRVEGVAKFSGGD